MHFMCMVLNCLFHSGSALSCWHCVTGCDSNQQGEFLGFEFHRWKSDSNEGGPTSLKQQMCFIFIFFIPPPSWYDCPSIEIYLDSRLCHWDSGRLSLSFTFSKIVFSATVQARLLIFQWRFSQEKLSWQKCSWEDWNAVTDIRGEFMSKLSPKLTLLHHYRWDIAEKGCCFLLLYDPLKSTDVRMLVPYHHTPLIQVFVFLSQATSSWFVMHWMPFVSYTETQHCIRWLLSFLAEQ